MRQIKQTLSRRNEPSRRNERGAVATIIVILFAGGIVLSTLALSADVGKALWERRQLQNGADAASRALTLTCAKNPAACNSSQAGALTELMGQNANDGLTKLDTSKYGSGLCGRNTGGSLPTCNSATSDASVSDLRECTPLPSWLKGSNSSVPYVEVYSSTKTASGSILPFDFGRAITGQEGVNVKACSRYAWGPPGPLTYGTIPVTFSHCEWQYYMNSGAGWVENQPTGAWPGYGGSGQPAWPAANQEVVIWLHSTTQATGHNCAINGKDAPGGFGYLDEDTGELPGETNAPCTAKVTSDGWANISTGNSAPGGCRAMFPTLRGMVIDLPVFSCLIQSGSVPTNSPSAYPDCSGESAHGSKSYYYITGWAKFYLSGYKIGGSDQKASVRSGNLPCTGSGRCLSGWFLKGALDAQTIKTPETGTGYGTYTTLPAG